MIKIVKFTTMASTKMENNTELELNIVQAQETSTSVVSQTIRKTGKEYLYKKTETSKVGCGKMIS